MNKCIYCKSDSVNTFTENEDFTYKGKTVQIPVEFSLCENCDKEYIVKQQILKNEAVVRDAKKSIDGLLTSVEIKQARKQLNLTQEQASLVFGGGKNAFSKYERAEVAQSKAMDKLIKVCLDFPEVFENLLTGEGIVLESDGSTYKDNIIDHPCLKIDNKNIKTKKETVLSERDYG